MRDESKFLSFAEFKDRDIKTNFLTFYAGVKKSIKNLRNTINSQIPLWRSYKRFIDVFIDVSVAKTGRIVFFSKMRQL